MRIRRVVTLLLVVALTGLFSGASGGAAPTAEAALVAVVEALPPQFQDNGWAPGTAPAVPAPVVAAPIPAAPVSAAPVPAAPVPAARVPAAPVVEPAAAPPEPTVPEPVVEEVQEPVRVSGTPCLSTARACIELSSNQAWLIRDGEVSYGPVPITHGRKGHRTPTGTFDVDFRNRDHVSSIYDAPMPYSVFFNGGIAFHQGSLNELSHGCIHLSKKAAREFFDSLRRGDLVQVES